MSYQASVSTPVKNYCDPTRPYTHPLCGGGLPVMFKFIVRLFKTNEEMLARAEKLSSNERLNAYIEDLY